MNHHQLYPTLAPSGDNCQLDKENIKCIQNSKESMSFKNLLEESYYKKINFCNSRMSPKC